MNVLHRPRCSSLIVGTRAVAKSFRRNHSGRIPAQSIMMPLPDVLLQYIVRQISMWSIAGLTKDSDHTSGNSRAGQAAKFTSLYNLSIVSWQFNRVVEPILYRDLVADPADRTARSALSRTYTQRLLVRYKKAPELAFKERLRYTRSLEIDVSYLDDESTIEGFLQLCSQLNVLHISISRQPGKRITTLRKLIPQTMVSLRRLCIHFVIRDMYAESQRDLVVCVLDALAGITSIDDVLISHSGSVATFRCPTRFTWNELEQLTVGTLAVPAVFSDFNTMLLFSKLHTLCVKDRPQPISNHLLNRLQMPALEILELGCLHLQSLEALRPMHLSCLRIVRAPSWPNDWNGELPSVTQFEMCEMGIWTIIDGIMRIERARYHGSPLRAIVIRKPSVINSCSAGDKARLQSTLSKGKLKDFEESCERLVRIGVVIQPGNLASHFKYLFKLTVEYEPPTVCPIACNLA